MSKCLHKPILFLIIGLLLFTKLLELLAINHCSPKRRIIFALPCSGCFKTCMRVDFPAIELDDAILSRMSGFLRHSSKWARRFGFFLQYTAEIEVLACSLDNDLNYVTTMLQIRPSLNP